MKLSIKVLKQLVSFNLSPQELAERINLHISEVEELKTFATVSGVIVAEILSIAPHPNADRLRLAKVDTGNEILEVVCGAPNIEVGQKVPLAPVGAILPEMVMKPATIRGVESQGMLCSGKELGVESDSAGVLVLPADAKVGADVAALLGLGGDDATIEIKVLSNRPDYLSYIGVAREIALLADSKLKLPVAAKAKRSKAEPLAKAKVTNPMDVPRYMLAGLDNIQVADSPDWLKENLLASGLEPINNIVDILNWTMLLFGQPLHAFDADKLAGSYLTTRRAKKGEKILALDGKPYELDAGILVIADNDGPVAVAGIIGSEASGVTASTRNIVIESANFDMKTIRLGSKHLGLRTEASARFEKGLDPNLCETALKFAEGLVSELAGGQVAGDDIDLFDKLPKQLVLKVSKNELTQFIGLDIASNSILKILNGLGLSTKATSQNFTITIPAGRHDIEGVADIVEEVVRMYGIDKVRPTLEGLGLVQGREETRLPRLQSFARVAELLGMNQVILSSLTDEVSAKDFGEPVELRNPLTTEKTHLRTSLLPALMVDLNGSEPVRVYEIGKVFKQAGSTLPNESWKIALGVADVSSEAAVRTLSSILEALASKYHLRFEYQKLDEQNYDQTTALVLAGKPVGEMAVKGKACVAEMEAEALFAILDAMGDATKYEPLPKFPGIRFDQNIEVAEDRVAGKLADEAQNLDERIVEVRATDEFILENGMRRLTLSFLLRSPERTLTEADRTEVESKVENWLKGLKNTY